MTAPLLTAHVESFADALGEVMPLLPLHWEELALFRDKMPLDPAYDHYLAMEERGELVFVAMRQAGRLVGYFVGTVGPSPHYQSTLTAKMDVIYIEPEFRGLGAGKLLLDTIKTELKRRGVRMWWMGSKNHKPIEALFGAYGFEPAETYFAMWIGD